ncbi:hypothetical protein BHE74_00037594 [Ensete ventricosum]|nr:hypothetical protein BHE74_00037594 [Ensete ventricosum]
MTMDPRTEKLIRRTAMVGTVTAAYLLLSADYGPQDHALLPVSAFFPFPRSLYAAHETRSLRDPTPASLDKLTCSFAEFQIKRAIKSMESSLKRYVFGTGDGPREDEDDGGDGHSK